MAKPMLLDLSSTKQKLPTQLKTNTWWISVYPKRDDLYWHILLSLLIPAARDGATDRFKHILKIIYSESSEEVNKVHSIIKRYNPFLNRFSVFHEKDMNKLIEVFVDRVKTYRDSDMYKKLTTESVIRSESRRRSSIRKGSSLLQAISCMLQCKIAVQPVLKKVSEDNCSLGEDVEVWYPLAKKKIKKTSDLAVLLYYEKSPRQDEIQNFSFSLSEEIGSRLQLSALITILKNARLEKHAEELFKLPGVRENFITALLQGEHADTLQRLLQQPMRDIWKLHEAGFSVLPTKNVYSYDSVEAGNKGGEKIELTSFLLACGNLKLLYLLYYYSLNIKSLDTCSRYPNADFNTNMQEIGTVLKKTLSFCETLPLRSSSIFRHIKDINKSTTYMRELCKFHSFQSDVCQGLVRISEGTQAAENDVENTEAEQKIKNDVEQAKKNENDVDKAKKIVNAVMVILESYDAHYYAESSARLTNKASALELYFEYTNYRRFFRNMDFTAALMFFDHSFNLKSHVILPQDVYSKFESEFMLFIFLCSYYSTNGKKSEGLGICHKMALSLEPLFVIPDDLNGEPAEFISAVAHFQRIRFSEKLTEFLTVLKDTPIVEGNVRKKLPKTDVYTMNTHPDIKDELIIMRLWHYLNIAVSTNVKKNFNVSRYVIHRALQVVGESVKPQVEDDPTPMKCLLISCMPVDTTNDLIQIRDWLCHQRAKQIQVRMKIDNDKALFLEIQKELTLIKKEITPIVEIQIQKARLLALQKAAHAVEEYEIDKNLPTANLVPTTSNSFSLLSEVDLDAISSENICSTYGTKEKRRMKSKVKSKKKVLQKYLPDIQKNLKELKSSIQEMCKKYSEIFKNGFENIFLQIENSDTSKNLQLVKVRHLFSCLKELSSFVIVNTFCYDEKKRIFLTNRLDEIDHGEILQNQVSKDDIKQLLEKYKVLITAYTPTTCRMSNDEYKAIHKFRRLLDGYCFLSDKIKEDVSEQVQKKYSKHYQAKEALISSIKDGRTLSGEEKDEIYTNLRFSYNTTLRITSMIAEKNLEALESEKHYCEKFLEGLKQDQLNKGDYVLVKNDIDFSPELTEQLLTIVSGQAKYEDRSLEFFYERIVKLKELLIDTNYEIEQLWKHGKSSLTKRYLRNRLSKMYAENRFLQAAVELLFHDCISILIEQRKELETLWNKTNYLFTGINLRKVLAHDNPLFEGGKFMDPLDMPNEIIARSIEFIGDLTAIESICKLNKEKRYYSELVECIKNTDDDNIHKRLCESIRKCSRWKDYVYLVPRAPKAKKTGTKCMAKATE